MVVTERQNRAEPASAEFHRERSERERERRKLRKKSIRNGLDKIDALVGVREKSVTQES